MDSLESLSIPSADLLFWRRMLETMDDLKTRITTAAQELLLADGPDGVSMRKIADKVGVTPPAIYRHFKDKDDLLDAIIGSGLEILERYLEPALRAPDPYKRLLGLVDGYLEFALEQPKFFDLAFLVRGPNTRISEELERHNRATFKFAVEQVAACMEMGLLRRGDPLETALLVWSTAHGLVVLYKMNRFGGDEQAFRGMFRGAMERMLEGFRPQPG